MSAAAATTRIVPIAHALPMRKTSERRRPCHSWRSSRAPFAGALAWAASEQALMAPTLVPQKMRGRAAGESLGPNSPSTYRAMPAS